MKLLPQILTPRQESFAQEFCATRSLARAYRKAYDIGDDRNNQWCHRAGRDVYAVPKVRARIDEITDAAGVGGVTIEKLTRIFAEIFEADPNELIALRVGACRYCNGEGHGYHWRQYEYLEALDSAERDARPLPDVGGGFDYDHTAAPHPDCPQCKGEGLPRIVPQDSENLSPGAKRLYGGVKHTKEGPQIILADRMKALEMLGRVIGAFKDNVNLSGQVRTISKVANFATTDPNEAAEFYKEMISGIRAD